MKFHSYAVAVFFSVFFSVFFTAEARADRSQSYLCASESDFKLDTLPPGCTLPEIGKGETYTASDYNTGMGEGGKYRINRLPDENGKPRIDIALNLEFTSQKPNDAKLVEEKVKACFARSKDWIWGEDGTRVSVRLATDEEKPASPFDELLHPSKLSSEKIRVDDECGERENSRCYSTHTDCGTILHEVFHILGLVDEYSENLIGYYTDESGNIQYSRKMPATSKQQFPAYDCRALGPKDSLMRNHLEALQSFTPECEEMSCTFIPKGYDQPRPPEIIEKIRTEMQKKPPSCPTANTPNYLVLKSNNLVHLRAEETQCHTLAEKIQNVVNGEGKHEDQFIYSTIIRETPAKPEHSLLYPAQFYRVLYPSCELLNQVYLNCSKNAYRTSKSHHGEGCIEPIPDECKNGTWLN